MKASRENHPYKESGLSCVTLVNVEVWRCPECGEHEVVIPAIEQLHTLIARTLLMKPARLMPEEIRFLRKTLGWSQADLARQIGVTLTSVNKWESGKARMGVVADKLLRLLVARLEPVRAFEKELDKVATKKAECSRLKVERARDEWRPLLAA
jgi:putative zinc finger/helix-turn-helix YgiT family protein